MASPFPITKAFVSYKMMTISAFYIQPLEKTATAQSQSTNSVSLINSKYCFRIKSQKQPPTS